MLLNAELLRPGSVIFVRHDGWISRLIRYCLGGFEYSHVAFYMGIGLILESDVGGVQINPISRYVDNSKFTSLVVNPPLNVEQTDKMTRAMLKYLHDRYDYSLLFGNAINKLVLKCNKNLVLRIFDQSQHWICSELIAEGLKQIDVKLPKPALAMTPKDIYDLLQKELTYD